MFILMAVFEYETKYETTIKYLTLLPLQYIDLVPSSPFYNVSVIVSARKMAFCHVSNVLGLTAWQGALYQGLVYL